MTDLDVIQKVARLSEVNYIFTDRRRVGLWKTSYKLMIIGQKAVRLMELLYPLMSSRRQSQITKALETYDPHFNSRNHAKLTAGEGREILQRKKAGEAHEQIALDFGIDRTTVSNIGRKSWRWVESD